jgi:hypothetical protein
MPDRIPLSLMYRGARERLTELVRARPQDDGRPVPATPGWTVHDALAHLTGVAEDIAGGWQPAPPTEEWTAGHVARGQGVPTARLLESWAAAAPAVERLLDETPVWALALDAGAHEQDVRGALGDRGARGSDIVTVGGTLLLRRLDVPAPLIVRTEHDEVRVGPQAGDPVVLTTTTFEAFRWRLGRRSRRQLAAMDWSGDPEPFLDHLCVFGPATADVVE